MLNNKQDILVCLCCLGELELQRELIFFSCVSSSWRQALRDFSDLRRQAGSRSLALALPSRFHWFAGNVSNVGGAEITHMELRVWDKHCRRKSSAAASLALHAVTAKIFFLPRFGCGACLLLAHHLRRCLAPQCTMKAVLNLF
jgi:hypothetical protein